MTTCTPIYGLTYAICSDRPCDIGETFCEFAAQVESLLTGIRDVIRRTETIPMAKVSAAPGSPQEKLPYVNFDTVEIDTLNMVNLTASSVGISVPFDGLYFHACYEVDTVSGALNNPTLFPNADGFTTSSNGYREFGSGSRGMVADAFTPLNAINSTIPYWRDGQEAELFTNALSIGGSTANFSAEETLYWFGDL